MITDGDIIGDLVRPALLFFIFLHFGDISS
jgi:hypothetical protein